MKIYENISLLIRNCIFTFLMADTDGIKKRINEVFDYLIDNAFEKNRATIAQTLGYVGRQSLWNAVDSYRPNSRSLLIKIGNAYPMVNTEWVKTGEGEMIRGGGDGTVQSEMMTDRFVKYLSAKNITTKDALSRLGWQRRAYDKALRNDFSAEQVQRIGTVFLDLNMDWLQLGKGTMLVMSQDTLMKILIKYQNEIDTLRKKVQKLEMQWKDRKPV